MSRKRILCYGDSNTWGYIAGSKYERFSDDLRFPKVLQKLLGDDFEVIEEGLNSRTIISEDKRPLKEGRNGSSYLIPCLDSHDPLDLVIIMLGTNELKYVYQNTSEEIGDALDNFIVKIVLGRKSQFQDIYPKVLMIAPPIINETTAWASEQYSGGTEKSKQLSKVYSEIAKVNGCCFIDASELEVGVDGVHMTEKSHIELAEKLFEKINKEF